MAGFRQYILLSMCIALCAGCGLTGESAYVDEAAKLQHAHSLRAEGLHVRAAKTYASFAREFQETYPTRAAMAQYLCGEEYFAAGELDEAVVAFERLVARFPHSPDVSRANARRLEVGRAQLAGDDDAGIKTLESLIDHAMYIRLGADARMALGKYHYNAKRFNAAHMEFALVARGPKFGTLNERARFFAACSAYWNVRWPVRDIAQLKAAREGLRRLQTTASAVLSPQEVQAAQRYFDVLTEMGARHHLRMARFYLKQGTIAPASAHLREVLTEYRASSHSETAARLTLLIDKEAKKVSQ
jgi:outer membrane protein assembly factor BamD (BamD/ComL family)